MRNIFSLPPQTIHPDGVTAMPFQPYVNVYLAGVSPCHDIEDATFCGQHSESSFVGSQQACQRFAGTIICEKTHRTYFRQLCQLIFQLMQLCLRSGIRLMFQCFSFRIDAPFKRLTLLLILPDGGSTCLVEFLFVLVQGAGHVTHDAGLTLAG